MSMALGQDDFRARIGRIEKRGGGVCEIFNGDGAPRRLRHVNRKPRSRFLKVPFAFLLGALAFLIVQYITFALGQLPDEYNDPDYILGAQMVASVFLVLGFRLFFNLTTKPQFAMSLMGLVLAVTAMHNLVYAAPDYWSLVFSPGWVSDVRAHTEPGTLSFRGEAILHFS
ncbi:hypothetical protein U5922_006290 [Aquicoccus sp. G2-2]|uniref:hypothetical protein n=1 Tax=Aquicoccus sp. G2-2 TaxID=3092120 RepID=UPI002ADF6314|nr:hypothetical protein [Aquicoccus sp. G2-2]MEA1113099.1 hypothetical protein [Aquicoccus sp. G2-2]